MNLTGHRVLQWLGILLSVGIIATGYYYFRASAGVKTNVSITDDPLALGLAGYWKLDDGSGTTATDSSARGNNGTLNSGPTWTTGQVGGAVNFDGSDDNITTSKTMANLGTVSAWVNTTATINSSASYYALYATTSGNSFFLSFNGFGGKNRWDFSYRGNFGTTVSIVGPTYTANTQQGWHHLTATWDVNSGATLYIDGQRASSTSTTTSAFNSMSFGMSTNSLARWVGKLDEVRMYSRVLSADEVANLYRLTSPTGVDTSLKGYWSFNGKDISGTTAYDRSGAGNNGTLTNGPTATQGKVGQALDFDGSNDYVATTDYSFTNVQSFTMNAWFKADTVSGNQVIFSKATYEYNLRLTGSTLNFSYWDTGAADEIGLSYSGVVANKWYLASITYDGSGTAYLYIDGVRVASDTDVVDTFQNKSDVFQIGGGYHVSGGQGYLNGKIDEVRIYNRALSAAEIKALYDQGQADETNTGKSQPQGTGNLDSGLAGYWKMDEGSGTSATDSSTNANTGTLTNGPTWTTGQIGGAVDFDGTDDYVSVTDSDSLTPSQISIAFWSKSDVTTSKPVYVHSSGDNSRVDIFVGSSLYCTFGNGTTYNPGFYASTWDTNWHHVMCTWNGTTVSTYLDGVLVKTESLSGTLPNINASLQIGRRGSTASYFDGSIDEVRIYNRALSTDEVSQLYRLTSPTGVDTSLKGYWSFNGKDISGTTAYDRSGAGNNGTLTNGPTVTPGKLGQALSFDGTNDYVRVKDGAILSGSTNATISAWIKTSISAVSGGKAIYAERASSGNDIFKLTVLESGVADNTATFVLRDDAGTLNRKTGSIVINDNIWHHIVAVKNGTSLLLYVDGVADGSPGTQTGTNTYTNANLKSDIGQDASAQPGNFNGSIDEVRIYNRALSAAEIQSLYKQGQADEVNTSASQPQGTGRLDSGLAGYWKLDDASGTSATDSSTNGNTGTLTNGPTWTTGQVGGAVNFDGTDDYIDVGDPASGVLDFGTRDFAVSVWVKTAGYVNHGSIYNDFVGKNTWFFGINSSSQAYFNVSAAVTGTNSIGDNAWHHVVGMRQSGTAKLFVDGVAQADGSTFSNNIDTTSALRIGNSLDNTHLFSGSLDEVRIYNRALSADEVSQLYRLTTPTGTDTSLKGYWSFNGKDVSGTTAYDRSGAGNNGTLTNGPTVTPGKLGQALDFSGATNKVVTVSASSSTNNLTQKTISFWAKSASTGSSCLGSFVSKYYWDFGYAGGCTNFLKFNQIFSTTNGTWRITGFDYNVWHHIAITYDRSSVSNDPIIYVDGIAVAVTETSTPVGTAASDTSTGINIGNNSNSNGAPDAQMDEFRLYDRILSAAEIQSLYSAGK